MKSALWVLALLPLAALVPYLPGAAADHNPDLYVSAENPEFENHFSGPMVVEVVVTDHALRDTGEAKGEPDVTVNGKDLRMAQGSDGKWYGYFANAGMARAADATLPDVDTGINFGVFCGRDTPEGVFGVSFSDSDGFAVPSAAGLQGYSNGLEPLSACSGKPERDPENNMVRRARALNTNLVVPTGQIGLDPAAWPVVQLFSFSGVEVRYNPGGGSQQVSLEYDEIPNVSFSTDRDVYPAGSEVFLTIRDAQLNLDPTDRDYWTFVVGESPGTFYRAFSRSTGYYGEGSTDMLPRLASLGFGDSGRLQVDVGSVLETKRNTEQFNAQLRSAPGQSLVTIVETRPNSGVFDTVDSQNRSVLGVFADAPRGQAGVITYGDQSLSVPTGSFTASASLGVELRTSGSLLPGTETGVQLVDPDQNKNPGARDRLDVSDPSSIIPAMRTGSPVTLEGTQGVEIQAEVATTGVGFSIPDRNSARLLVNASQTRGTLQGITIDTGVSAERLYSSLIDPSKPDSAGTSWLHYDFGSLGESGVEYGKMAVGLSFGQAGADTITLASMGEISESGMLRIEPDTISDIGERTGRVFLEITVDQPDAYAREILPIVADFVSFGVSEGNAIANAVYRFELRETGRNSSTFEGTLEYSVPSIPKLSSPNIAGSVRTIDDDIRAVIDGRMTDEDALSITYADLANAGVIVPTTVRSDAAPSSGTVSLDSNSYRFGQTVTVTLVDPDLNLDGDILDFYTVNNDPNSPAVDTVGSGGAVLLEVSIKGIPYKRCTVDGVEHGGLGASGFALTETGPGTGVFKGTFKMPSQICNRSGTALISPAGGSVDVKYRDSADASGNPGTTTLSRERQTPASPTRAPQLDSHDVVRSSGGPAVVMLSGSVDVPRRGVPLVITVASPDGKSQEFAASVTGTGAYRSSISVRPDSPAGTYTVSLEYYGTPAGTASFEVRDIMLPSWLKEGAGWWSSGLLSDSEFTATLGFLVERGLIVVPEAGQGGAPAGMVLGGARDAAGGWSRGLISDGEFAAHVSSMIKMGIIGG